MPNSNNNSVQDKFITLENLERYNGYVYPDEMSWDEYQEIEPEAGKTYFIYDYDAGQSAEAVDVAYDNTSSELQADNVQDAIDELKDLVDQGGGGGTDTTYTLSVGTGTDVDKIILTPSTGTPDKITVPYATNAGDSQTVKGNIVPVDFEGTTAEWNALTDTQKKSYDRALIKNDYDLPDHMEAYEITYNNTPSGLSSTNVQDAIDEVNGKVITSDATISTHGLMSASDKTKLNSIATGANATTVSTSSNAQGAISVNINGTASNVGLKGIYFGRAGSINDLSTTNSVEGGSVSITIDQPFTSFSSGDRLVVFFYNEYVYDLGDADTYEVTLYVNGSSIGIPVLRSVSLIPLKVTSKLPLKQGLAYTFTYANVTPVGNCFVVNEIPDTTVKYTGTSSGWTGMTKNERKTYDIAYITND